MSAIEQLDAAFRLWGRGVADRRSAFHTPTLVTVDGGKPRARTVVLRRWAQDRRMLAFHTDIRSPKVPQIRREPAVELHVYDAGQRLQVRASGPASVHHQDQTALDAWTASAASSRQTYRVTQPPGETLSEPEQADLLGLDEASAYANFAVVCLHVAELEVLSLASSGHRRARATWPDGQMKAEWLVP